MTAQTIPDHSVVSPEAWLSARRKLLEKEKELTRLSEEVAAARRQLPWTKVDKNYVFDAREGEVTLAELFQGRSQLIVYHFMFSPDWVEGCEGCSFLADHIDGARQHLIHHDVMVAVVSRAPVAKLESFRERMGWKFPWVSSFRSDFNFDYHVSVSEADMARGKTFYNFELTDATIGELPGVSVFFKNEGGEIFHTYSSYARGAEQLVGAYHFLEITPRGRNENGPNFNLGDWVKHHDRYEETSTPGCCCGEAQMK